MPKCLGMLGNSAHTIKMFSASLAKENIEMPAKEFLTVEDLIDEISIDIDAVFVTEKACSGAIGGREEVIKKIRAADSNVRIIFCSDSDQRNEEFENWCQYQRVGDFFYPERGEKGELSLSIKPLAACVKRGRLEPFEADTTIVESRTVDRQKGSGFFTQANALVDKLGETLQKSKPKVQIVEKEVIKYVDRDVPGADDSFSFTEPTGAIIIGVFNICRGAGATTMAVEIAKESSKRGTKVYIISADGSDDLSQVKLKDKNIKVSVDSNVDQSLLDAMCLGVQLIIFDFGVILNTDKFGNITTPLSKLSTATDKLITCKRRIAMTFSAPWHLQKLTPFISGQYPKLTPTHLVFDKRTGGVNFPYVYARDQLTPANIVDDIGVTKKSRRLFGK